MARPPNYRPRLPRPVWMRSSVLTSASMSSRRIVERQRRTHRGFEAEAAEDRLGAVVAGAHGDALLVERLAHVLGAAFIEHERDDARLLVRRADEAQAGHARAGPCVT